MKSLSFAKWLHLIYLCTLWCKKNQPIMGTVVFDNDGRRWNAKSPALRAVVSGPPTHFEFLTCLVDVLGFVAVTRSRHGVTWIHLRPTQVSQVSLCAALFALADQRPSWVVV